MRSSGDGLLGGDSKVDAPSEGEAAVLLGAPSPAARVGAARRPAGFARRRFTATVRMFTDVMTDAIVPFPVQSGALRSLWGIAVEMDDKIHQLLSLIHI